MAWTARDFERLDPKLFRGFLAAAKTGSFSEAATHASLTQGAISQQVAKLEERLEVQLFVRGGQKLMLTDAGRMLADFADRWLTMSNSFAEKLHEQAESIQGLVSYSMPESCIHSPHFGMLLGRRQEFPNLRLQIALKPTPDVYADLLRGEVDFGFLTEHISNEQLELYPFCVEEYVWVGSAAFNKQIRCMEDLPDLPFISFPGVESLINRWAGASFPQVSSIPSVSEMDVQGTFNDIRGALAMVKGGLGVSVFPSHVVGHLLESSELKIIYSGPKPALQQIYIARLKHRYMPARVRRVIGWFLQMHADLQPVPSTFLE